MKNELIISWFSAGVSSAVATKLLIDEIDDIYYIHIDDQHDDTMRFVKDCEQWFGKEVKILQSPYKNVENACLSSGGRGYINGPSGAACTKFLKRRVRAEWEMDIKVPVTYVWGMDCNENNRIDRIKATMPKFKHRFPLHEQNITKAEAHGLANAAGIRRPVMYDLGYPNNNCIGCVKGGMGYWNKIRQDFPEVFAARAAMERRIEATCIKGVYLDELKEDAGRDLKPIVDDCGIFCEVLASEIAFDSRPTVSLL